MKKILYIFLLIIPVVMANAQTLLEEAVDFTVKDVNGQVHSLFEYLDSGKHVVIDFYSTSCGYCQLYAPEVQASYEKFGQNNGDVIFMTIDKGHTNAEVVEFDETYGITMPSVAGIDGNGNEAHLAFQVQATPSVVLIAPDYSILEPMIWPATTENIDAALLNAGLLMVNVDDFVQNEIRVFPNPAASFLNIDFQTSHTPESVALLNILGQELTSFNVPDNQSGIKMALDDFANGMYFIKMQFHNGEQNVRRVVIKR